MPQTEGQSERSERTDALVKRVARERAIRSTELMSQLGVDHMLLGTADNIRYTSDVRTLLIQESADWVLSVFDKDGMADVFVPWVKDMLDHPYQSHSSVRSLRPVPGWVPVMAEPDYLVRSLAKVLDQAGARVVGYDAVHPELVPALKHALPRVDFRYVGGDLFRIRSVKFAGEVELMRQAHDANLAVLERVWSIAVPGVSDYELLAESLAHMSRSGAEQISHVTCNIRAEFAIWHPTGKCLRPGEPVFIDQVYYGTGGYASDLTRTVFVGEPDHQLLAAYAGLIEARGVVEEAARPGVRISDLDDLMSEELTRRGLAQSPYALGHGIGLRACEPPAMTSSRMISREARLEEGQTIALEPETMVDHQGATIALKIEDCFVVEGDGLEPLGPLATAEECVLA